MLYDTLENTEIYLRAYRTLGRYEGAIYFFRGFYKQPRGIKSETKKEVFYPKLNVYGLSLRGPVTGGIGSIELGYYDSREDKRGNNRLIENSSIKYLLRYERDMGNDLTAGIQYFVEEMLNYDRYKDSLMPGDIKRDEFRHLLTMRLTKLLKQQTVELSIFTFYSPSDRDIHLRPRISYDITDRVEVVLGANIFGGKEDNTFFGQLEGNNNIYSRLRYSF